MKTFTYQIKKCLSVLFYLLFTFVLVVIVPFSGNAQKAIFLHHSTGGNVYSEGNVSQWVSDYNSANNTQYSIAERAYPNAPYAWENYPYDFWYLWVGGGCSTSVANIECLESLVGQYDVIIFKHCFPGAGIGADNGAPDVSSGEKTLANYKLQYRALRDKFETMPNTKFIVWTLVPLHRLSTDSSTASRAAEFVKWVKEEWLTENGIAPKNIFIFDFWGYAAETSVNPEYGETNCLKYDYEGSHTDSDSHPNSLANQTIGPLFAQFVVDVLSDNSSSVLCLPETATSISFVGTRLMINPCDVVSSPVLSVYNLNGQIVYKEAIKTSSYDKTLDLPRGVYEVALQDGKGKVAKKIRVE